MEVEFPNLDKFQQISESVSDNDETIESVEFGSCGSIQNASTSPSSLPSLQPNALKDLYVISRLVYGLHR